MDSCLISAIGYRYKQLTSLEELIRMDVEAEAREKRLPLGQVFERCNVERGMRAVEIQKDDVALVISMVYSCSQD